MKVCHSCGAENRDDSRFCCRCGISLPMSGEPGERAEQKPDSLPAPPPPPVIVRNAPVYPPPKPEFTRYDLSTIFGFVASLVGLFQITLILEPLALLTSILGFARGKRYRGLAIAGTVIAAIGLLLRFFYTLYLNGLLPQWVITGTFD